MYRRCVSVMYYIDLRAAYLLNKPWGGRSTLRNRLKSNHEDAKSTKPHKEIPRGMVIQALFVLLRALGVFVVGLFKQSLSQRRLWWLRNEAQLNDRSERRQAAVAEARSWMQDLRGYKSASIRLIRTYTESTEKTRSTQREQSTTLHSLSVYSVIPLWTLGRCNRVIRGLFLSS